MFFGRISAVRDEDIMDGGSSHTVQTGHSSHSSDMMRGEPTSDGLRFRISSLSEEPPPQLYSDTVHQNMMHPNPIAGFMYNLNFDDDQKKPAANQLPNMLHSVKEVDGDFMSQQLSLNQVSQTQHDQLLFGLESQEGMPSSLVGTTVSVQAEKRESPQDRKSMINLSGLSDEHLHSLSAEHLHSLTTSLGGQEHLDSFSPAPFGASMNMSDPGSRLNPHLASQLNPHLASQLNPHWGMGQPQMLNQQQQSMISGSNSMPNMSSDFMVNHMGQVQQANSFHGFSQSLRMQMMPNLAFPVENAMSAQQQPMNSLNFENQLKLRQQMLLQPMHLQGTNQMGLMMGSTDNFGMPLDTMNQANLALSFQQQQNDEMGPLSDLEEDGTGGSSTRKPRQRRTKSFPEKLLEALTKYASEETASWLPDGKSFVIVNDELFVDRILSKEFKASKYSSFVRKLHRWGFVRLISGTGTDCFHHPLFQRGREDLVAQISSSPRCQKSTSKSIHSQKPTSKTARGKLQRKSPSFCKSSSTGTDLSSTEDQQQFGSNYTPASPHVQGDQGIPETDPLSLDSLPTDTLPTDGGDMDLPDDVVSEDVWDDI